jgi:hypothetical protein
VPNLDIASFLAVSPKLKTSLLENLTLVDPQLLVTLAADAAKLKNYPELLVKFKDLDLETALAMPETAALF